MVHLLLTVICHLSRVTCHGSHITVFFVQSVELFGGGSVINGAEPVLFYDEDSTFFVIFKNKIKKVQLLDLLFK